MPSYPSQQGTPQEPEQRKVALVVVAHPDDERYRPLFDREVTTPLFGVNVPVKAHPLADPQKGTGIAMIARPPTRMGLAPKAYEDLFSGVDLLPTLLELLGVPRSTDIEGISHARALIAPDPAGIGLSTSLGFGCQVVDLSAELALLEDSMRP